LVIREIESFVSQIGTAFFEKSLSTFWPPLRIESQKRENREAYMSRNLQSPDTIFGQAIEIEAAEARAAFLDQACGNDPQLRGELEKLVEDHFRAGKFLEKPALDLPPPSWKRQPRAEDSVATLDEPITERPGTVIGPYKLLEQIGEGGFGVVFMAEQQEPIRRMTALKVLKPGMDTRQVIARFEAERQALALMDHPNIAKVLDAGQTSSGRPYFVMDLVKGLPITEFCDQSRLTTNERLELFVSVCRAVQHAHQKGIIHRDIKPSNVLVTLHDGAPVPKIIDFGIAKALGRKLTDKTMYTGFAQLVGTPLYMSPEQAELSGLDIDTRTDIYSLGVLLYELLTGTTPFDKERLKDVGYDELRRIIREEEPPKPSTRISTMGQASTTISTQRKSDPKRLSQLFRGELDWIVMKALEKDRERRYETASAFAADVQHYLHDEAVQACPPTFGYTLRKFITRNRVQVVAGALVFGALVIGIAGTTFGLVRAEIARGDEAEQRRLAEEKQQEAENEKTKAQAEKKRAIEFRDRALAALRATTGEDIEKLIGGKKELGENERQYLEAITKRWQEFAKEEGTDELAQVTRGEGHHQVADLLHKLGRRDEARGEYEKARDIRLTLTRQFPEVSDHWPDLATTHNNLGVLLEDLGQWDDARGELEQARDIWRTLTTRFPNLPAPSESLADTHNNLGGLLNRLGRRNEARAEWEKSRDIQLQLTTQFPAVPSYLRGLAVTHNNLGQLLDDLGQGDDSRGQFEKAVPIWQKLTRRFPNDPAYQTGLVATHNNLGSLLVRLSRLDEAHDEYGKARELGLKLTMQFPNVPEYHAHLAMTRYNLGRVLALLGKWGEARAEYERSCEIRMKLTTQFPKVMHYQAGLGISYLGLGNVLLNSGKTDESLEWIDKAIATLKPVLDQEPRNVKARESLRDSYRSRAIGLSRLKKHAESFEAFDKAIELSPAAEKPEMLVILAVSRLKAGQVAQSVAEVAELTTPPSNNSGPPQWTADHWYNFACVYSVAAVKIADKKLEYADRAMELLHKAVQAGYKDAAHMAKDTDLDPLRDREDFKKLMESLPKAEPKK
jgi:serine/threonine protein kinase/Flp pilus assembly protein TadD